MSEERRDDWRQGVDQSLAMLTSAQRTTDKELEDLDVRLHDTEQMLHGDTENSGLIGRIETLEHQNAELRAIILTDATGEKGLQHDVQVLMSGEKTSGERWKFATAFSVAIISLLGLLITNWQSIQGFIEKRSKPHNGQSTARPRHARAKTRHVILREVQPQADETEEEANPLP